MHQLALDFDAPAPPPGRSGISLPPLFQRDVMALIEAVDATRRNHAI